MESFPERERVLEAFPNGVCFIELAAVMEPEFVLQTVAVGLGLHEYPGRSLLETIIAFLKGRQILLVLDNCEHVLEACTRLADELLRRTPSLKILVTSRERLGIGGKPSIRYCPWRGLIRCTCLP